jgi:hypothetical protein
LIVAASGASHAVGAAEAPAALDALPAFLQRSEADRAVRLEAPAGGILTQRGRCLGVVGSDGRFATLFWPASARMKVDVRGLAVVDAKGGGRVRLGDYMAFTGGLLPRGTVFPLGGAPMECAHWPGYDGWLGVVNPGFRAVRAPATPPGHLPIARGFYAARPQRCGEAGSLFHYDGARIGWTVPTRDRGALHRILRVREEKGWWVATIRAPGPGEEGAASPRDVQVFIEPQPVGRIIVEAYERTDMRLCSPDELPAWAWAQAAG